MFLTLTEKAQANRISPLLPTVAVLVLAAAAWSIYARPLRSDFPAPQTISVLPDAVSYRQSGEFLKNGMPVDGQLQTVRWPAPLMVMKYQVSEREYAFCVGDGACDALDHTIDAGGDRPVTGVSFLDTEKYSLWLSGKTGQQWRLPTDQEWAALAGSKYNDDAVGPKQDAADPSQRWIRQYESESAKAGLSDPVIHPSGFFGTNENDLVDLSGNISEWTSTCYTRSTLSENGSVISVIDNCGVRVVEGEHRAYMTAFIRDAKSGGCSVGTPPDYLGMRLIREQPGFLWRLWTRLLPEVRIDMKR